MMRAEVLQEEKIKKFVFSSKAVLKKMFA